LGIHQPSASAEPFVRRQQLSTCTPRLNATRLWSGLLPTAIERRQAIVMPSVNLFDVGERRADHSSSRSVVTSRIGSAPSNRYVFRPMARCSSRNSAFFTSRYRYRVSRFSSGAGVTAFHVHRSLTQRQPQGDDVLFFAFRRISQWKCPRSSGCGWCSTPKSALACHCAAHDDTVSSSCRAESRRLRGRVTSTANEP